MTRIISRNLGISLLSLFILAGCSRSGVIHDVIETRIVTTSSSPSIEEIGNAIILAGKDLGWAMKLKEPGVIHGLLILRVHKANIEITFTTEHYSIKYVDSDNLNYRPAVRKYIDESKNGPRIHSNYNGWITNLERKIEANLFVL